MVTRFILIISLLIIAASVSAQKGNVPGNSAGTITNSNNAMEFVPVPGGCFSMGSSAGGRDEMPVHDVCVSGFYMAKYEVTQGQWRSIMGNNPSRFNRCGDDCPVEQVSWHDAQDFIQRLNSITGREHRLPTEAEWEYACRSGGIGDQEYCGSVDVDVTSWHEGNSGRRSHPVGKKAPNSLGIFDMSGNVWEWVQDWKGSYPSARQIDPVGAEASSTRVRRGGSWLYGPGQSRAAWRSSGYPGDIAPDIGFRLAVSGSN
ncbi:serine/threonine-protein kinase pkn1 [Geobacter sp. OR-1]|uniref:formylglycine-generating enzyme family protein n=1 Tax=Geobacter sp. OR-1 TaxID=1266765 RepID=UPI00054408B5|nr:formylglycine-generating enzyme family protein [Geobacter sp. OR-1]GAM09279.1 serine/threonine-protein kinase pkn1 [Geobacter sp. OR-1]